MRAARLLWMTVSSIVVGAFSASSMFTSAAVPRPNWGETWEYQLDPTRNLPNCSSVVRLGSFWKVMVTSTGSVRTAPPWYVTWVMLCWASTKLPPLLELLDDVDEPLPPLLEPELLEELLLELLPELLLDPDWLEVKTQSAFSQVKPLQQSAVALQLLPPEPQTAFGPSAAGWLQARIERSAAQRERAGRDDFIALVRTICGCRLANGSIGRSHRGGKAPTSGWPPTAEAPGGSGGGARRSGRSPRPPSRQPTLMKSSTATSPELPRTR